MRDKAFDCFVKDCDKLIDDESDVYWTTNISVHVPWLMEHCKSMRKEFNKIAKSSRARITEFKRKYKGDKKSMEIIRSIQRSIKGNSYNIENNIDYCKKVINIIHTDKGRRIKFILENDLHQFWKVMEQVGENMKEYEELVSECFKMLDVYIDEANIQNLENNITSKTQ